MKKIIVALFVLMCLAQWIVPGKMVYDSENTIAEGTLYKFKTAPVDPSDPMRGKYITLNFQENFFQFTDSAEWRSGDQIFVTFTTDSAGFAVPEQIYHTKPDAGSYLETVVEQVYYYKGDHKVWYKLPFDRFYMEESKAPQAEQLYWKAQRDSLQIVYALVSIGQGQAVLQDVIINDRPITEIINELNKSAE
jgi:uncharacterized membrane-anchored protein